MDETQDFAALKERLDAIVEAVSDDELPLDQALSLYEEAVGIGLQASALLEQGVLEHEEPEAKEPDDAPGDN